MGLWFSQGVLQRAGTGYGLARGGRGLWCYSGGKRVDGMVVVASWWWVFLVGTIEVVG